jgi:arginine/lysine/ornithine decarboxylase
LAWRKEIKFTGRFEEDIKSVGEDTECYYPNVFSNPVIKQTSLTSLLAPEEIWKELQNYISSLNNDEDVNHMTNVEKIENYGFDKKISFRGK